MEPRKRFQLNACTPRPVKRAPAVPKAADVVEGAVWCKPPDAVVAKLGGGSQAWCMGVDIETNDWGYSRGNRGSVGQFGFYNLCAPADLEARIVQLGCP